MEAAALLGLRLIREDAELQAAIRRELDRARGRDEVPARGRDSTRQTAQIVRDVREQQRKLLDLYYADAISSELFAQEEARLQQRLAVAEAEAAEIETREREQDEIAARFDEVAAVLADLDLDAVWQEATAKERRVLVEELVDEVAMFEDHLEVTVSGAPRLNVRLDEVGLGDAERSCERGDSNSHSLSATGT